MEDKRKPGEKEEEAEWLPREERLRKMREASQRRKERERQC
jgi:hypothetical protein